MIGLGFWVQGFRCFPWMAVNFLLKDGLKVDPSTLQILQNSANLPMVGKPLYGLISDSLYISGQRRLPYIAIGALLQAVSWLAIAIFSRSSISISSLSLYLLLTNLGASIAEVANDAIVAELGKKPLAPSSTKTQSSSSGELQSFVWMASSAGGVLGNLLGGLVIDTVSAQSMFLVFAFILFLQFLVTISVSETCLNLLPPKASSSSSEEEEEEEDKGIRKQLQQLTLALRRPDIAYSVAWFAASYAIIPALTGTMFFYQTHYLNIDASLLGISKVFGQAAMLLWGVVYNQRFVKSIPPRKLIAAIQATMAVFMISDMLFVKGTYRAMGIPDAVYVVVFSGLLEVLFFFKVLPFSVLIAQLCPPGCEGSLMAFVMSAVALALIVSGYLGVALASFTGVRGDDFSGFPVSLMVQAICTVLPLLCSSWIADSPKPKSS